MKVEDVMFLDIETVPTFGKDQDEMPDRLAKLFEKKFQKRVGEGKEFDSMEKAYRESGGLLAEFCQIVAVSIGMMRKDGTFAIRNFSGRSEAFLLSAVAKEITQWATALCAHNGKSFDFPILSRKFIMLGIPLPKVLNTLFKKPWDTNLLDTMELWKFTDNQHRVSLDLLCESLGIKTPKDGIDGSMVADIYFFGDRDGGRTLDHVSQYCGKDVEALARCYAKITGQKHDFEVKFF